MRPKRRSWNVQLLEDRCLLTFPAFKLVTESGVVGPGGFTEFNDEIVFTTDDQVWITDLSAEGTRLIKDHDFGSFQGISDVAVANGFLFWRFRDEVWVSDGTAGGTSSVTEWVSNEIGDAIDDVDQFIATDTHLFFQVKYGFDWQFWSTQGTSATTSPVTPATRIFRLSTVGRMGNKVIFDLPTDEYGREPWITDGTGPGTMLLKDIAPGPSFGSFSTVNPHFFASDGNRAFFAAGSQDTGTELWLTDGTADGTKLVKDINPGDSSGFRDNEPGHPMALLDGVLYFTAHDDTFVSHRELWRSDGTAEGTWKVVDESVGLINDLVAAENRIFFTADTDETGKELWTSDGTTNGTRLVGEVNPGGGDASIQYLTALGDSVFFRANNAPSVGKEVWRGTADDVFLWDLNPGAGSSNPHSLTAIGDRLFLGAEDDQNTGFDLFILASHEDPAGFSASKESLTVSEAGTTDSFTVRLTDPPTGDVRVTAESTDVGEATVSPVELTFTAANWNTSQTITVTGVEDDEADGSQLTDIVLSIVGAPDIATQSVTVTTIEAAPVFLDGTDLIVNGTEGDDEITVRQQSEQLTVTLNGDDYTFSTSDSDQILINTFAGDDEVDVATVSSPTSGRLGSGNDKYTGGSGADTIRTGTGADTVLAGKGRDFVNTASGADLILAGNGDDRIQAGHDSDTVRGEGGDDTLSGGGGPDSLIGGSGDDQLGGGSKSDTLVGGAGNDSLFGGSGRDIASGGSGNDLIDGEKGNDVLTGGAGRDLVIGSKGGDSLTGGSDDDILVAGTVTLSKGELKVILDEWGSVRSYENRVANIRGADDKTNDRLNDDYLVGADRTESQTAFSDEPHDTLAAGDGVDVLFAGLGDHLADQMQGEWLEVI